MKKVLSVLLAAAMVMGMSVSSFALTFETSKDNTASKDYKSFGSVATEKCYHGTVDEIEAGDVYFASYLYINGKDYTNDQLAKAVLNPGDVLTFVPMHNGSTIAWTEKTVDEHWNINVKDAEYVDSVAFGNLGGNLVINVTVAKELDDLDEQEVTLKMYIADNYSKATNKQSEGIKVVLPFDNQKEEYVSFDYTNDVDYVAKWIVAKNTKGTATFDFEDEAYFTVKMIPEEEVVLNFSTAYDKDIDKAYNEYDAELSFYNFKGESDKFTKVGELFIPADKDTFIYEIVDGKLVEVDAEYSSSYKVDGLKAKKGWVIETKELGYYVVSDVEAVLEVEETETPAEETNKANPETGAADFVGAAVAMAVVSVAAAGALALKK